MTHSWQRLSLLLSEIRSHVTDLINIKCFVISNPESKELASKSSENLLYDISECNVRFVKVQ